MTNSSKHQLVERLDFMAGGGKMGVSDPLPKQQVQPKAHRTRTMEEIDSLVRDNSIVENIVTIPSEDMTRAGFEIITEDEATKSKIEEKLNALDFNGALQLALMYKRKYGDGFISIGVTQTVDFELSDPMNPNQVKSVDYIHPFSPKLLSTIELNEDVFDINYGEPSLYKIKGKSKTADVDPSRVMRFSQGREENEIYGRSVLEPMFDIVKVFDIALWSTGQILFDYTFKVMKTKDAETLTREEMQEARLLMDFMFRTEALAILSPEEDIQRHTANVGGISELLNFMWEALSGAAKMPKNVILGQQQGTITGGQYDILNYFNRVEADQENILKPYIMDFIKLLCQSSEINKPDFEFDIEFNSLWSLDDNEQADVDLKNAQTDQIYMQWGVLMDSDVREKRFPDLPPLEEEEEEDTTPEEEEDPEEDMTTIEESEEEEEPEE